MLGAVGTTTAACSPYELQTQRRRPPRPGPSPSRAEVREVDPDVPLATAVVAAERALLDLVAASTRRHPRLERVLAGARAVHEAHVALFEDAVPRGEPTPSSDPTAAESIATTVPGPGEVPRDRLRALRSVASAEDALALTAKQAAFAAQSGAFARVLASIAAAAAQQSAVLRTDDAGSGRR